MDDAKGSYERRIHYYCYYYWVHATFDSWDLGLRYGSYWSLSLPTLPMMIHHEPNHNVPIGNHFLFLLNYLNNLVDQSFHRLVMMLHGLLDGFAAEVLLFVAEFDVVHVAAVVVGVDQFGSR